MADRFQYVPVQRGNYTALRPLLPITLIFGNQPYSAVGLLDTGADISVLPYQLGVTLGQNGKNRQRLLLDFRVI